MDEAWKAYRDEQWGRRQIRVPQRLDELRARLPADVVVTEVNGPYAVTIVRRDVRLTYYPTHNRVQWRGQWRTMTVDAVVRLFPRRNEA